MPFVSRPLQERLWEKVGVPDSYNCWPWLGAKNNKGYGVVYNADRSYCMAHRVAYEIVLGPIPDGLYPDHLCRNRSCVNPWHIEPVTNRENVLRGDSPNRAKTHCKNGHPFNAHNTLYRTRISGSGFPTKQRFCRICNRNRMREKRLVLT